MDLGFLAYAGGIDEHELVAELVVMGLDGVPGRSCDRGNDVPLLAQQGIGEGGLADIRLAHDGYPGDTLVRVRGRSLLLGQDPHDFVEQVARTGAVSRGDAPYLTQA